MRRINPTEERGPCGNKVLRVTAVAKFVLKSCSTLVAQALTQIHSR